MVELKLEENEVRLVLDALAGLPYARVHGLIPKIIEQSKEQDG